MKKKKLLKLKVLGVLKIAAAWSNDQGVMARKNETFLFRPEFRKFDKRCDCFFHIID